MEYTHSRRRLSTTLPPSPLLLRSRSTTPANAKLHADYNYLNNSFSPNSCHRVTNHRPKSASKSRTTKNDENVMNPSMPFLSISQKIKPRENVRDDKDQSGFAKFLQSRSSSTSRATGAAKGVKSVMNSPSAWALSPGRSSGCRVRPDSPGQTLGSSARPESPGSGGKRVKGGGVGVGVGVGGVLKYFKQRKVSPPLVEEFHRFRVMHNRLLQWRFVNARGEAAVAGVKRIAEMFLLDEWSRLERRNQESVSRLARKLLGLSVRLPLVEGAKADVVCLYEVLTTAMGIMDSIEAMIAKFFSKIETTLYLLTELRSMLEQEDEYLEELEMAIPLLRTLLVKEESVQIHLIQAG